MGTATPAILELARRLIALEAAHAPAGEAARACDKLRAPLARLAGVAGFRSLLARALALAASEVPWLESVQVRPDGSLEGLDEAGRRQGPGQDREAAAVILARLLGLLVTFIGEPLTMQQVSAAWPDAALHETNGAAGGRT